jgi:hypothetical protein
VSIPSPTPAITFRPGVADDWVSVSSLAANTCEDEEPISSEVWKEWAEDDTAQLIVATFDSDPIAGFARVVKLGPAEWWLQGIRIDPGEYSRAVGRALLKHIMGLFERDAIGLLRFFTTSTNEVIPKLAEDLGFRHTMSYAPMQMPAQPADYRKFKRLQPPNLAMIYAYLRRSPMYRVNHFVEYRCTAYYLTQERLGIYLADPAVEVLGWRQFDQLNGLAILMPIVAENDDIALEIAYLDAPDDTSLRDMMSALSGLAAKQGRQKISWRVPQGIGLDRLILISGLEKSRDGDLWLYELPLRH